MGQCVTINVGNRGAVIPEGGSNINVGNTAGEEEEEEDCLTSCLGKLGCALCL